MKKMHTYIDFLKLLYSLDSKPMGVYFQKGSLCRLPVHLKYIEQGGGLTLLIM